MFFLVLVVSRGVDAFCDLFLGSVSSLVIGAAALALAPAAATARRLRPRATRTCERGTPTHTSGVISAARSCKSPWIARLRFCARNALFAATYSARNDFEFRSTSNPALHAFSALSHAPSRRSALANRRCPFRKSGLSLVHSSASSRAFSNAPSSRKQSARFE